MSPTVSKLRRATLAGSAVFLTLVAACGERAPVADGGAADARGSGRDAVLGDGGRQPGGDARGRRADGSGAGDGSTASGWSACLRQVKNVSLSCPAAESANYVAYGKSFRFPCLGASSGGSKPQMRLMFDLAKVKNTVPQIEKIVIAKPNATRLDGRIELTAPQPVALSNLPKTLRWPARIRVGGLAAGLSFIEGQVTMTLEFTTLDTGALYKGGDVRGTFRWRGGTYQVLDKEGRRRTAVDPSAEGRGCFRLQAKIDAIL